MTHEEIEKYRLRLVEIWNLNDKQESKRQLKKMADELGASGCKVYLSGGDASRGELSDYIQNALQTASMIETCRIATENYGIAVTATKAAIKNYRIAAAIAILAMLGAWAAVVAMALTR